MLKVLKKAGYSVVALTPNYTKFGTVETREDARKCADLFRRRAGNIDGVVVTLPNFGDERGVADTLKMAGLNVPRKLVVAAGFPKDGMPALVDPAVMGVAITLCTPVQARPSKNMRAAFYNQIILL